MKIIKEKLDLGKAMENNNPNMKKIDDIETVVAAEPGYAQAISDEEKLEKHFGDVMKDRAEEAEGITPEDPNTGKKLPRTIYTEETKEEEKEKDELDESLFEDIRKVGTLPNDVYTLVYDLLFPGLVEKSKKPHLIAKEEEITIPEEKSFIDLEGADIGVQIKGEEDDAIVAYVKKIAEILGLETYEKKVPGELKYGDYVLAIKIPEELSEKNATEFLANLGIDEEGIRGKYRIKESFGQEDIRREIGRYFDYAVDADFVDVVEDIIYRVDDPHSTDDVMQAIDDGLIYTSDQWTVLQHYCTPQTANWEDAIDEFITDIYHIVDALNKAEDEDKTEVEETEVEVEETDESLNEKCEKNEEGRKDSECEEKKLDEEAKVFSSLSEYEPWSGAVATWDKIMEADKFDKFDAYIEEMYPDGIDVTDLNDLLWFDGDSVLEALGISEEDEETDESISESGKEDADKDRVVIYKENGVYKTTPESNYNARIQNARKIHKIDWANSPKDIIDYFIKYGLANSSDDFKIVESVSEDEENIELDKKNNKNIGGIEHL